ncbi:MAG: chorismate mutase [Alphaproteobacteria bacterium]|nr:chorismate mutase [Alphaproteobacteria bacterium]
MKKFNTIEEIRNEIDKLDLKIVELISQRKDLVSEVVKLKRKDQIIDQERIDQILKKLNLEAKKRGIPEVMIEKLWDIMIKSFIKYEEEIYDEVHKK